MQDEALHYITALLTAEFHGKNLHDEDRYGISPHTLKYTLVNGKPVPFGLCKVEFL